MLNRFGRGCSKAIRKAKNRQHARRKIAQDLACDEQEWSEEQARMLHAELDELFSDMDGFDGMLIPPQNINEYILAMIGT